MTTEEEEDAHANEDAAPGRLLEEGGGSDSQEDDDTEESGDGSEEEEDEDDDDGDGDDSYDGEGNVSPRYCCVAVVLRPAERQRQYGMMRSPFCGVTWCGVVWCAKRRIRRCFSPHCCLVMCFAVSDVYFDGNDDSFHTTVG